MTRSKNIVYIICTGGHAKQVIDIFLENGYDIKGAFDDNKTGNFYRNIPILGKIDLIEDSEYDKMKFFCCIGDNKIREQIYTKFKNIHWINCISSHAYVSPTVKLGYGKVSQEKGAVAKKIRDFVIGGGFMFAMCSATDSFDIALSADGVDICEAMFDGDASESNYQSKLNYGNSFAFKDFTLERKPEVYEFSDIDMTSRRRIPMEKDYFTLMEFSAKWDPIPSMLCQNHTQLVKGFMGQTTSFDTALIKSNVLIMGTCELNGESRYIHGEKGKGMFTFFGGHDPEDFQHQVGDPPTVLDLHPNSPGYRLILNNVLFPAAKKKKLKT